MYEELVNKLQYSFRNPDILQEALTHSSIMQIAKNKKNYERLEFLGDTVLSLVITTALIKRFPEETEGDLARRRSALINGSTLYNVASKLNIAPHIILAKNEEENSDKYSHR